MTTDVKTCYNLSNRHERMIDMATNPLIADDVNDLLNNFREEFDKQYAKALKVADQSEVDQHPYALAKMALMLAAEQFAAPKNSPSEQFQKRIYRTM